MTTIKQVSDKIKESVGKVFKGDEKIVDMILAGIFAGGHILLEDVPGTGKTVLAKAIAKSSGLAFSRIQCTPDLMPSDVTGSSVWLPARSEFEFRPGPLMSSIVLVDELNRATPRTQSALLEAMAESIPVMLWHWSRQQSCSFGEKTFSLSCRRMSRSWRTI